MGNNPILHNDPLGDTSIPWPARVNQTRFDPSIPVGVGPNKNPDDTKPQQGNGSAHSGSGGSTTTVKQTGTTPTEEGSKPLLGSTTTQKVAKEIDLIHTPLLDKVTISGYKAKIIGKEGSLASTDNSYTNGKWDGASVTIGPLQIGVNRDLSVQAGLGMNGAEGHISVGLGVGFGQIGGGGSYKAEDGTVHGGDITVRPGFGAVLAVAGAVLVAPILAF